MVDRSQPARVVDEPEPVFVRLRVPGDRAWYGARIYKCLGMLMGEIDSAPADIFQIWHGGTRITETEYAALLLAANSPKPF